MEPIFELSAYERLLNRETKTARETEDFWNTRAETFNKNTWRWMEEKEAFIKSLLQRGIIGPDSTVLDLGCGPGTWSITFAPYVKEVVGADISDAMLSFARENGKSYDNCSFRKINWWDCDLDQLGFRKRFDVVFNNTTPAVHDAATFYKMMDCSKGYCIYSSLAFRRSNLTERLGQTYRRQLLPIFNLLWLRGLYPTVEYGDRHTDRTYDLREDLAFLLDRFDLQSEKQLREAFRDFLHGDLLEEHGDQKIARMIWQVPAP